MNLDSEEHSHRKQPSHFTLEDMKDLDKRANTIHKTGAEEDRGSMTSLSIE
jgi:hypothetical protein